jgi:hypothetical protein
MNKFGALFMAALLGGAITGAIASAGSSITSPTQIATVEANKVQHTIDNGKAGFGIGDVITVSDDLNDPTTRAKLGHMHEVCTVIHAKKLSLECVGTAELAGGQISVTGEFPPADADASYSITGGTGTYDNVGGKMTIADAGNGVLALTFFLVP